MEVLDNNNSPKDGKELGGSQYTCRLPRDLNIGSGSIARSKNESDIRLLLACKTQLSSEVIKWKTESLRLQKERDSARLRMRELDQVLGKYSDKMRELELRLSVAENENKKLKGRVSYTPNISALKKRSLSLDKFHSYPWSEAHGAPSHASAAEQRIIAPQDDWREVSQQLLEKMKQEMKEFQEFNCSFCSQENSTEPSRKEVINPEGLDDNLEKSLSGLISETVSLKQSLLEQRLNLKLLLRKANKGKLCSEEQKKLQSKSTELSQSNITNCSNSLKAKPSASQLSRLSDDSFREFFTKQLEGSPIADKISTTQQPEDAQSSQVPDIKRSSQASSGKSIQSVVVKKKETSDNDRVCPICQTSFDEFVPQNEFEDHVLDHLEKESTSLLDQYVVL